MKSPDSNEIRLLLVEDSPADVYLVREAMRREGLSFCLQVADNGETAIQILNRVDADAKEPPPGLLLVDLNVPRKDGAEVLERLRHSPRCGGIPVIMISSSDSATDRRRAFDLGATEYFLKPSSLAEMMSLGKMVRRLIESHSTNVLRPCADAEGETRSSCE
jgi:two-component system, chemotaxis family, response regulator Rcp1